MMYTVSEHRSHRRSERGQSNPVGRENEPSIMPLHHATSGRALYYYYYDIIIIVACEEESASRHPSHSSVCVSLSLFCLVIRHISRYLYIILSDPQSAIVNEYNRKRNARHILQYCIGWTNNIMFTSPVLKTSTVDHNNST